MCHALVIEDEWLIAEYVGAIAEQAGATSIDFADSEAEAVAAAKRQMPAIILSDVQLRGGTGPAAVAAIQRDLGPVPVIFITGTPDECHPCGPPAVVLRKPIIQTEILAEFRRLAPIGWDRGPVTAGNATRRRAGRRRRPPLASAYPWRPARRRQG